MPPLIDLIGQRFGRLVVIRRMGSDKHNQSRWLCRCVCQKETIVLGGNLRRGLTRSCGCFHREQFGIMRTTHGYTKNQMSPKVYTTWRHIIERCTNPNDKRYHDYGGRGITVCKRWLKFENFLEDMGEPPTIDHSIDREDNNGNYCKSNCRWATRKEQARNTRSNHLETFDGKTQCLAAWAEEIGIDYKVLWSRLSWGWSIDKALTTPVRELQKGRKNE